MVTEKIKRILLVEDDRRLAMLIADYLGHQGYDILIEGRGDTAEKRILAEKPSLVILDLMLPGKDGLSICKEIRSEYSGPILILTAKEDDMDQVAGLEIGADDYVKKPVEPRVLLARIRALLRRYDKNDSNGSGKKSISANFEIVCGSLRISKKNHTVILDGEAITLTTNEFDLLWYLASHRGKVLDRETIYRELRGIEYDGLDRSVDLTVSRIRKKLKDLSSRPEKIKTIWGQGYLFVESAW